MYLRFEFKENSISVYSVNELKQIANTIVIISIIFLVFIQEKLEEGLRGDESLIGDGACSYL